MFDRRRLAAAAFATTLSFSATSSTASPVRRASNVGVRGLPNARVASETVLHAFVRMEGQGPSSALTADVNGNLYGTAEKGGFGLGVVYELTPPASGRSNWTETVLHEFTDKGDGMYPGSNVIIDASGNLFGTTGAGGAQGFGCVYELSPPAPGKSGWSEQILWSFSPQAAVPSAGLVEDASGDLYGTTQGGGTSTLCGSYGCGTVFELTPPPQGQTGWTLAVLYDFGATANDGTYPEAPVLIGPAGVLFGTTEGGGGPSHCSSSGCGTVFELTPPAPGQTAWTETQLLAFHGADGGFPQGQLIADSGGALYGMTYDGGPQNFLDGLAFKLSPPPPGKTKWAEQILHVFTGENGDGMSPQDGLIADPSGNLYGTTSGGGHANCTPLHQGGGCGITFALTPPGADNGAWTETILSTFGRLVDGVQPRAGLLRDASGNLYGTTFYGGGTGKLCAAGCGTVFEIH